MCIKNSIGKDVHYWNAALRDLGISRTDTFLILTAMSRTQMSAVLGKMEKVALEEWDIPVLDAVTRRLPLRRQITF